VGLGHKINNKQNIKQMSSIIIGRFSFYFPNRFLPHSQQAVSAASVQKTAQSVENLNENMMLQKGW
jgi:hypothetical protein